MNHPESSSSSLPHHRLIAYQLALELVKLVGGIRIRDSQLRAQARKSAASAALNAAEGAARQSLADKSRAYAIALAECCEACAAVEIAEALGACSPEHLRAVLATHRRALAARDPKTLGVETAHQILDTAFAEDDHPWIESHPRAALVVAILRRVSAREVLAFEIDGVARVAHPRGSSLARPGREALAKSAEDR